MQVSEKETRAVFLNFKEMRVLEKSVQALDLEGAYSASLISLEQKVMKARDKKMRDRVSKIKSHLSTSDLAELKILDEEGRLDVRESSSKLNSNLIIAAASKRLKLIGRAKSAVPRLEGNKSRPSSRMTTQRTPVSPLLSNRSRSPIPVIHEPDNSLSDFPVPRSVREERRGSIWGPEANDGAKSLKIKVPKIAFADKSDSDNDRSPHESPRLNNTGGRSSMLTAMSGEEGKFFLQIPEDSCPAAVSQSTPSNNFKVRPLSVPATQVSNFGQTEKRRPSTTNPKAMEARNKSVNDIRRASMLIKSGKTALPFSSHDKKKPQKSRIQRPYRPTRDGKMSATTLDSKDNDIGQDLFTQIREGMILGELATSLYLEEQIDDFFENLDTYKKENPTHFQPTYLTKTKSMDTKTKPKRNELRRRQLQQQLNDIEARKKMADDVWKNASKCRYLRIQDDRLDISGVNTLVKDQMNMLKSLRD